MTMTFACDAPVDSAQTDILAWMQSEPSATYWALVDAALLGASTFATAARHHQWPANNALANTPLEGFGEVAPHLISIHGSAHEREKQIKQLLRLTRGTSALSWLRSAYPLRALQMLFGYLAKAQVRGRARPIHLRFADTRILPSLLQTLSPSQQCRVVDIVEGWRWFDRYGHFYGQFVQHDAVAAVAMDSEAYLHLSMEQFDQLLTDAEADGVFYKLTLKRPELVPPQHRAAFRQRLAASLSVASEMNLSTEQDRWLFVLLSLSYGDGFHRCEALVPTWEVIREHGAGLQEQMQGWSAETLKALTDFRERQFNASASPSAGLPIHQFQGPNAT